MRDYTPEYESFRDDAVAVINGLAIMFAVVGTWTRPIYMGVLALAVALCGYLLNPRSKGGHILAVTNPLNQTTSYTHTGDNVETKIEPDPDDAGPLTASTTTYSYDSGRLTVAQRSST